MADDTVEHHPIRYFKRETLIELLECSGLELLCLGSFPAYWREPDVHHWSVLCVARAIGYTVTIHELIYRHEWGGRAGRSRLVSHGD